MDRCVNCGYLIKWSSVDGWVHPHEGGLYPRCPNGAVAEPGR